MRRLLRRRVVNEKLLANTGTLAVLAFLLTAIAAVVISILHST